MNKISKILSTLVDKTARHCKVTIGWHEMLTARARRPWNITDCQNKLHDNLKQLIQIWPLPEILQVSPTEQLFLSCQQTWHCGHLKQQLWQASLDSRNVYPVRRQCQMEDLSHESIYLLWMVLSHGYVDVRCCSETRFVNIHCIKTCFIFVSFFFIRYLYWMYFAHTSAYTA